MKAVLLRTGSIPVQKLNRYPSGSPSSRLSQDGAVFFGSGKGFTGIRRSNSDTDIIRSESNSRVSRIGSVSFPDMSAIIEEEIDFDFVGNWPGNGMGNGNEKGNKSNGGGNGGNDKKSKIGEHYQEMLKANPGNSLLLRNYAKYLHEVEKNTEKAEEYYGRAILASPGDGELLSLYGKLIWETQKDEDRAKSYFDQAVQASPDDCMVLGSYASFLWEADEDEEEDGEETKQASIVTPAMVGAY